LHGVHEELQRMPPGSHCITEVATRWGFTEHGRFAACYKNLLGELPHATLSRAAVRAPLQFSDLLY
jgi:transcriptional regulator GlxA family with amidase domain